jgi:hypothetical protein
MTVRGAGDRWLAGEALQGIHFGLNEPVTIVRGHYKEQCGCVVLLLSLDADPVYLVALGSGGGDARVRQSQLRTIPQ